MEKYFKEYFGYIKPLNSEEQGIKGGRQEWKRETYVRK